MQEESEQHTFPKGEITYLISYEKGADMPTKEAEKFAPSSLMEGMTSVRAVFAGAEAGVNDRKIEKILFKRAGVLITTIVVKRKTEQIPPHQIFFIFRVNLGFSKSK